jgi:hypothetical protein
MNLLQAIDSIEINQSARLRQTEIHQWNQTLAAGKNFGIVAMRFEHGQGLSDASWTE